MEIDFKEFSKDEIIEAAELMLKTTLLPSLESHLIETLNNKKYNRLVDERNKLAVKWNNLLDHKQTDEVVIAKEKIKKQLKRLDEKCKEQLQKLLDLKIIDQERYDELYKSIG